MKCLNCGTEWDAPADTGDVVTCPSCGAVQVQGAIYASLDGALLACRQYLGDSRLREGKLLYACFIDLAPGMVKEAKMLKVFLGCGGHTALLDARDRDPSQMRAAAERIVYLMKEDLLGEAYCRTVVGAFCRAVGCGLGPDFDGGSREPWAAAAEVRIGTILCGEYTVTGQLELSAGDADLYICSRDGQPYTARIYQYKAPFRTDAVSALMKLDDPRVLRLCAAGSCGGCPVEIYPYCESGSLQGQTFRDSELVSRIIPDLNEGLSSLHAAGVLHRGVKTSNIAHAGDGEHVFLMISKSTVLDCGSIGSSEYAAPETVRGIYTDRSDYYSLGIVIYELFCGYLPTAGSGAIVFPKRMPLRLRALITGLTAPHDLRWGCREVCSWLDGGTPPVPGGGFEKAELTPPFRFSGQDYTDLTRLSAALSEKWEDGKKSLFDGSLSDYFRSWNLDLARKVLAAADAGQQGENEDLVFWRLLYQIDPRRTDFCWTGRIYENLAALGREVLDRLWDRDPSLDAFYTELLDHRLLTRFVGMTMPKNERMKRTAGQIEAVYSDRLARGESVAGALYLMGYLLSGQKILLLDGTQIRTTGELAAYMRSLLADSLKKFEALCCRLADADGSLDPQLEAWLIALGRQDELERWSAALNT